MKTPARIPKIETRASQIGYLSIRKNKIIPKTNNPTPGRAKCLKPQYIVSAKS